ncbi:MAG: hypothetical protein MJK04_36275, partial [Psychrosphaera sp.]|nr:hypothetical protein [Psychrosphaera sp.]
MKVIYYLMLVVFFTSPAVAASVVNVTYASLQDDKDLRNVYFIKLLQLALDKSKASNEEIRLHGRKGGILQGRAVRSLKVNNQLDVLWTVTTIAREQEVLPIRIPLIKGLLGYRFFIIRQADKAKFKAVNGLKQLRKLTAGQGHDWPDTEILRANQLKVVTGTTYLGLFGMLKAKRFDYFPRSINEAWMEAAHHQDQGLMLEDR